jgi:putative membrane protein insertion efficiency factor
MGQINRFLRQVIGFPIILYQVMIRPLMKPCCRFYPSCSDYALTAIQHFGIIKGIKLTCFRLLRCHPWTEGGYDPVLPNKEKP